MSLLFVFYVFQGFFVRFLYKTMYFPCHLCYSEKDIYS